MTFPEIKMRRRLLWATGLLAASAAACVSEVRSQPLPASDPKTRDECYLRVALNKTSADMAFVARELCDAVFAPQRRSLFVLDPKTRACGEWWLDNRGRYETAAMACFWESVAKGRWSLACQQKENPNAFSLVELVERDDSFERAGEPLGVDPGLVFKTMTACLRHKSRR